MECFGLPVTIIEFCLIFSIKYPEFNGNDKFLSKHPMGSLVFLIKLIFVEKIHNEQLTTTY